MGPNHSICGLIGWWKEEPDAWHRLFGWHLKTGSKGE
jgi:hypothetical protein